MRSAAFTLIELLIVVLIIATLAAIALPHFLEFQTRAKISSAYSGQRVLSVALEAYRVEQDNYPPFPLLGNHADPRYFNLLTTPVAYLSSADGVIDPFAAGDQDFLAFPHTARRFGYFSGTDPGFETFWQEYRDGLQQTGFSGAQQAVYLITSPGPDLSVEFDAGQSPLGAAQVQQYDPTNGTVSLGDIFRPGPQ